MKLTGILADSHSSITRREAERLGIRVIPTSFSIDGEWFSDQDISRHEVMDAFRRGADVATSMLSPGEMAEYWDSMLEEYDEILFFPLSSGLSSECQSAQMLSAEEKYAGRVHVVDTGRISTPQHRTILDGIGLLKRGLSALEVKEQLEAEREKMAIFLCIDTMKYLVRGGRVTHTAATVSSILHIKPVLELGVSKLDLYAKCRGIKRARETAIAALKDVIDRVYQEEFRNGRLKLMAAVSSDDALTADWLTEIRSHFPGKQILCDDLSLGVCCHTGADALGVGFSISPEGIE